MDSEGPSTEGLRLFSSVMLATDDDVIVLGTTRENDLWLEVLRHKHEPILPIHDFAVNQLMGLGFDVVRIRIMSIFGSFHAAPIRTEARLPESFIECM